MNICHERFGLSEREIYGHLYAMQNILEHLAHAAVSDSRELERVRSQFGLTRTRKQIEKGMQEYDQRRAEADHS